MAEHVDRYIPANTNAGWGIASLIIALVIVCIVGATYIHKETYKHPTDPTWHGIGSGDDAQAPIHTTEAH